MGMTLTPEGFPIAPRPPKPLTLYEGFPKLGIRSILGSPYLGKYHIMFLNPESLNPKP